MHKQKRTHDQVEEGDRHDTEVSLSVDKHSAQAVAVYTKDTCEAVVSSFTGEPSTSSVSTFNKVISKSNNPSESHLALSSGCTVSNVSPGYG